MVDSVPQELERKRNNSGTSEYRLVFRRVKHGLWRVHGGEGKAFTQSGTGSLVARGTGTLNEFKRTYGSTASGPRLPKMEGTFRSCNQTVYGQHRDLHLHQQYGGPLLSSARNSVKNVTRVRKKEGKAYGGTSAGRSERASGPIIAGSHGQVRLVSKSLRFSFPRRSMGPSHGRFLRNQVQREGSPVCYVAHGRPGDLCRRTFTSKEEGEWLRKPSFFNYRTSATENKRVSAGSNAYCTSMASPVLVASASSFAGRSSSLTAGLGGSSAPSRGPGSRGKVTVASLRLSDLRKVCQEEGFSEEATKVMCARWAQSTLRNYEYCWRRWAAFCGNKGGDRLHPAQSLILDFLFTEFKKYNTASCVNAAISSLSSVLSFSMGVDFMSSAWIRAFRRSVNISHPTGPAIDTIWDLDLLFVFIASLGDNATMQLDLLQMKVIILLRIDLCCRTSDLVKLFRSEIKWTPSYFQCRFLRPKEWRPNGKNAYKQWSRWVIVHKVSKVSICTYRALEQWLSRTEKYVQYEARDGILRKHVLCSLPRGGVAFGLGCKEISQIAHLAMINAGVPAEFKPQTIRSAVASAAKDYGASMEDILNQGRWSEKSMFLKFYYRKIPRSRPCRDTSSFQARIRP